MQGDEWDEVEGKKEKKIHSEMEVSFVFLSLLFSTKPNL